MDVVGTPGGHVFGNAVIPFVLLFTLLATAGLAVVPQACSTITPVPADRMNRSSAPTRSVRADGQRQGGETVDNDSVLRPGESVIVTAHGFDAGSQVCIRIGGSDGNVGTDFADSTGTVRFIYKLPDTVRSGPCRLIVEDVEPAGGARVLASTGRRITTVHQFALLVFTVA